MGRTNTNVHVSMPVYIHRRNWDALGNLSYDTNYSVFNDEYLEERVSQNTPGFRSSRSKLTKEKLPLNPFFYRKVVDRTPYGRSKRVYPDGSVQQDDGALYESFTRLILPSSSAINALNNNALAQSLTALKGIKVNLGVAWGERKQTSDLILSTAKGVGKLYRDLRSGNLKPWLTQIRSAKRVSKSVSDNYLALRYGVQPLLSDAYGAAETLARLKDHDRWRTRISFSKSIRWNDSEVGEWNSIPNTTVRVGQYTVKYVYFFSVPIGLISDLKSVGVTNPASILWELTPWSFVFDWFLNIGQWLDSFDATLGLEFEKGCKTTFIKNLTVARARGTKDIGVSVNSIDAKGSYYYVWNTRETLSGFPHMSTPNWGSLLNTTRMADAVSLIFQRLSKK